jgi:hypothetical protein
MKKRKFNGGGMTEEEVYAKPLAKASFKEAFAEARAAGDKTFEYMGKKYSTDLAGSKKKSEDTKYGEDKEMVRKAYQTAGEMRKPKVDEAKRQADMVKKEKGLERVSPELDLLPAGKVAAGAAGAAAALKGASSLIKRSMAKKEASKKAGAESSGAMKGDVRGDELRYKAGGKVASASRRADGCAIRGKTRA